MTNGGVKSVFNVSNKIVVKQKHFLTRTGGIKAECLIKFVRCQHKVSFRLPASADLHLNRAVVKATHVSH